MGCFVSFLLDDVLVYDNMENSIEFNKINYLNLYFVTFHIDNKRVLKVGITHNLQSRLQALKREYNVKHVHVINSFIIFNYKLETQIIKYLANKYPHLKYNFNVNGIDRRECFHFDDVLLDEIKQIGENINNVDFTLELHRIKKITLETVVNNNRSDDNLNELQDKIKKLELNVNILNESIQNRNKLTIIPYKDVNDRFAWAKIIEYDNLDVVIMKCNEFINASKICTRNNKKFADWSRHDSNKELINECKRINNVDIAIMQVLNESKQIRGTFVHRDLFPIICTWADPRNAIKYQK